MLSKVFLLSIVYAHGRLSSPVPTVPGITRVTAAQPCPGTQGAGGNLGGGRRLRPRDYDDAPPPPPPATGSPCGGGMTTTAVPPASGAVTAPLPAGNASTVPGNATTGAPGAVPGSVYVETGATRSNPRGTPASVTPGGTAPPATNPVQTTQRVGNASTTTTTPATVPAAGAGGKTAPAGNNLKAGSTAEFSWFVQNLDGSGPVRVAIDPNGGTNFATTLQVATQVPGTNGNKGKQGENKFTVQIPAGMKCTGCMIQVLQPNGFGSCAVVNIA